MNYVVYISIFLLSFACFFYGLIAGSYHLPPYKQIQKFKEKISKESGINSNIFSSPIYLSRIKLFEYFTINCDVVFLGDSLTKEGQWSEAFPDNKIANRGVSGDTSEGIIRRIEQILEINPKIVFIMIGINDIGWGAKSADIIFNYRKILEVLSGNGIEVVIQSTLLSDRRSWNIKVNDLNSQLVELSRDFDCEYIDVNKVLAPSGILTTEFSFDGIHLKPEAYIKWFDLINRNFKNKFNVREDA